MKGLLLSALVSVAALSPLNVSAVEITKQFRERCLAPTVAILRDGHICGSGFIIESKKQGEGRYLNTVATCWHLFGDDKAEQFGNEVRTVKYNDEASIVGFSDHAAVILNFNEADDVAILAFRTETAQPTVELADKPCKVGDVVTRIGCGLGLLPRFDDGQVTAIHPNSIRANVWTIFGDSGGPIFHNGKVVGLTQAIAGQSYGNISYFIPIAKLKRLADNDR